MMKIFVSVFLVICCNNLLAQTKTTEHTFDVDKVTLAKYFLPTMQTEKAYEYKIQKPIKFIPPLHQNIKIVATKNNAFIQAIQNCYDEHRPLVLSPDIIWLTITQAVSIHINQNFDTYKNLLFKDTSSNKIEIIKREDSLSFKKDYWSSVISRISDDANKNVNADYYKFFVPKFSTTTAITKTVFEITMLEAFKKKFVYVGESGCGIPKITIKGTMQDWQWIYNNLDQLNSFGLQKWADELKPIIQQFINASEGKVDKVFWKDIYKNASEYNGYFISGWVIKLFPYIEDINGDVITDTTLNQWSMKMEKTYKPNPFLYKNTHLKSTLATNDFPSGLANIDLRWDDYFKNKTTHLKFYAGFMGIKQYDNKTLEPFISWAITDTFLISKREDSRYDEAMYDEATYIKYIQKHKDDYWSPHFAKKVTDSAVYDIKRFKTIKASLKYIRQVILDSLQQSHLFIDTVYKNKRIAIEILSNGTVGAIHFIDSTIDIVNYAYDYSSLMPTRLELYIKHILESQPQQWFPAIAHPADILDLPDTTKEEMTLKVKANSIVTIVL